MLDDQNWIRQRDSSGSIAALKNLPAQTEFQPQITGGQLAGEIGSVVITGVGSSAVVADIARALLRGRLPVPIEVIRGYQLDSFVNQSSLVIVVSYSGDSEEVISCFHQAQQRQAQLAVVSGGGELLRLAEVEGCSRVAVPSDQPSALSMIHSLKSLLCILQRYSLIDQQLTDKITASRSWLESSLAEWLPEVAVEHNYAKQLALAAVGKTAVFYGGELTAAATHKWQASWQRTAKNLAFSGQFPEFSHDQLLGWSSQPIEKPFAVFDLRSSHESRRIIEQMELADRLLSGMRPKARVIDFRGDSLPQQLLWSLVLADATSIYLAMLNNVDPLSAELSGRFRSQLS